MLLDMQYKTHNDTKGINVTGTSLHSAIECSFDQLVQAFGKPMYDTSGDDKVKAEWYVEFDDGVVATIYDWKSNLDPKDNTDWHIGGFAKGDPTNYVLAVLALFALDKVPTDPPLMTGEEKIYRDNIYNTLH
jgi:hypothetical protein